MKIKEEINQCWSTCKSCEGEGKKKRRLSSKQKLQYQTAVSLFENNIDESVAPTKPKSFSYVCEKCNGSGLVSTDKNRIPDRENFPHIAIIGAGIGGIALAVACLHRGIPFTIYEKDNSFDERSQGYGLTLQQASKAIEAFGIFELKEGVVSTRHVVHNPEGKILGEWGMRKWMNTENNKPPNRTNIHIARQSLRMSLLEQLGGDKTINWGHQLSSIQKAENDQFELSFNSNDKTKTVNTDLVVGADGIRSSVRKLILGEELNPLKYLGCIVILGICPLKNLEDRENVLLDSATVFQTANGNERIYMMPYDEHSIMWQLSFLMTESEAIKLSQQGKRALKEEAIRRTPFHDPVPQILQATAEDKVSGYPVYDRDLLNLELLNKCGNVTLIGDAAHPMSPFKGQGANQALLDAIGLARTIYKGCKSASHWKKIGLRESILNNFEEEMLQRTSVKVKDSAAAATFLHTEAVLFEGDQPRGRCLK